MSNRSISGRWWWLTTIIVLCWLLLLVGGYFWAHRPFDADLFTATGRAARQWAGYDFQPAAILSGLGGTLAHIAGWLFISYTGVVTGRLLFGGRLAGEKPAVRLALLAGVGLGMLSIAMLVLGLFGLVIEWAAWLLLLALNGLAWRQHRPVWAVIRALRLPRPENRQERWFLLFGLLTLVLVFFTALAPPTGWDSLVYHLTGPKWFIETGRVGHPLDLAYLGFPLLGGMQFTLGMLAVGPGVTPLLHFGYGLMALAVTAGLAETISGRAAAWFAGVLLLAVPSLLTLMAQPYVDAALLFYATAAFFAFYRWRQAFQANNPEWPWLLMMGLFCGFGGGVKYTAVLIPFALALSLAWTSRHTGIMAIIRRVGLVALVALAAVLPWLLENWISTGNPVYPFFFDQALYWDTWRGWWYDRPGTGLLTTAPWRLLLAPLEATILGTEGSDFYDFTLGPLLLLALGLLALVWRSLAEEEKKVCGHLLLFLGLNMLFWLWGLARTALLFQTRLLLPVFGVAAVSGGVALSHLGSLRFSRLNLAWMIQVFFNLALGLLLLSSLLTFLSLHPLPVLAGLEPRQDFLERRLGAHAAAMAELNQLPAGAVVLFLWEPRSFYCATDRIECRPDALLDRWLHHTHYLGLEAAEIAERWQAEGVTHVLLFQQGMEFIYDAGFDPLTPADLERLSQLQDNHLQVVKEFGNGNYLLYELKAAGERYNE